MLAMQYSIPLPAGYDPAWIKDRVEARRGLFDVHAGLVHKSFLYNEKEQLYAPFYLWKDVGEARDFLLDDLFKGVVETFNRHRVRSWYVVSKACRGMDSAKATYARREIDLIPAEETLAHYLQTEKQAQEALMQNPALCMHVVAIDADRWEVMRFSLWLDKASSDKPAGDCIQDYDVLHVSTPESRVGPA
jgi:hypothetical protein